MEQTTTESPLWLRPARPDDLQRLGEMLERCSPETLYRRFHGTTHEPMRREIAHVAAPATHDRRRSWVATSGDGAVRGTATLAWRDDGTPELALLVEDAWFRRGIGRGLVHRLAGDARRAGADAIVAWVQGDNLRAVKFLRAIAPGARIAFDSGELAITIPLPPATRRDAA
jgi:N-acetylglutamate synthase-like GNAT family acetyltransferase